VLRRRRSARWAAVVLCTPIVATSASVAAAPAPTAVADEPPSQPTTLTVDGLAGPIGLAPTDVQFAWHVGDSGRGAAQTAFRVIVASVTVAGPRPGATTVVWDSGRVTSGEQAFVAYGGSPLAPDSVYQWTVQTWGAGASGAPSAFARPGTFETGLADSDWRASWIRRIPADPADARDEYTYARKEVMLGSSPIVRARAYVSGDQQYELYVNGTRVGKGGAYSYPDTQYYETLDVTRNLRAGGDNAIGVLYNWQGATKGHPAGAPGAITEISVLHADGSTELVATDGTWRVLRGAWLPGTQRDLEGDQVDYTENVNGPAQPVGWDQPHFDDSRWAPVTVIGPATTAPWTHLVSVRTRIVEQPVAAVSLTRLPSGAVVADFGKVYAAVPTVTFHHGVAGRVVTMRAGYLLDETQPGRPVQGQAGQVSTVHGTQHTDMSYSYVQRGGVETFHPFDYLGFRYLEIDDPGEKLTPRDVVALTRHSAVPDEHAATFSSSDPTVDNVFELGRHSALFTAQEQFVDTPTREKGPWLWDGFNESQTATAAFGEQNLTRKSLLEFAQSQARYWPQGPVNKIYPTGLGALDIAEFTEIFPEWLWQYWMHTGDQSLLTAVYPVLSNLSDYVFRAVDPSTGLVTNLPATDNASPLPVDTRQNVLGVNVFRRTGDVATVLGRPPEEISRQRQRQSALAGAINSRLTRPDGVYVDGLEANGTQAPQASQPSNTAAIAYGVVPPATEKTVAGYVATQGMASPPRTAGELLEALALAGRDDAVVTRLTDAKSDGWANILARGGTFTWEVWDPSDANGDSMSHGWGSNVLVEIQQVLLGVRPAEPGYASVAVAPPTAGLVRANGRVPTPRGDVSVSWDRPDRADGTFFLDVSIPPNATASVRVPAVAVRGVTESGRPLAAAPGVHSATMDGAYAVVQVGAGTYRFRSSPIPAAFVAPTTSSSVPVWEIALIIAGVTVVAAAGIVILLVLRRRHAAGAGVG
jgi:alpha-L-rhamnosidase